MTEEAVVLFVGTGFYDGVFDFSADFGLAADADVAVDAGGCSYAGVWRKDNVVGKECLVFDGRSRSDGYETLCGVEYGAGVYACSGADVDGAGVDHDDGWVPFAFVQAEGQGFGVATEFVGMGGNEFPYAVEEPVPGAVFGAELRVQLAGVDEFGELRVAVAAELCGGEACGYEGSFLHADGAGWRWLVKELADAVGVGKDAAVDEEQVAFGCLVDGVAGVLFGPEWRYAGAHVPGEGRAAGCGVDEFFVQGAAADGESVDWLEADEGLKGLDAGLFCDDGLHVVSFFSNIARFGEKQTGGHAPLPCCA